MKDELLHIEHSLKVLHALLYQGVSSPTPVISFQFSDADAYTMFAEANLRPIQRWTDSKGQYSLWLLERPPFLFPTRLSYLMEINKSSGTRSRLSASLLEQNSNKCGQHGTL
jgi:hypothetical protein